MDDFWYAWSTGAEESLFRAYCRAGGPVAGNPQMYLGRVGCGFVSVVLVAGLLVVPVPVGYTESVRGKRLTLILLNTLKTLLLLLFSSLGGGLSRLLMYFEGIRQRGFSQARVDALQRLLGCCLSIRDLVGALLRLEPWGGWIPLDGCMVFPLGYVDS